MKALSMLDHVMLWVARGFAVFVFSLCVWAIVQESRQGTMLGWRTIFFPSHVAGSLLSLLLVLCVWNLWSDMARLFLALLSPFIGFGAIFFAQLFSVTNGSPDELAHTPEAYFLIPCLLGSGSLFWAACRTTQNHSTLGSH